MKVCAEHSPDGLKSSESCEYISDSQDRSRSVSVREAPARLRTSSKLANPACTPEDEASKQKP